MKIAIVDSNYADNKFIGLSASWLHWELNKLGVYPSNADNANIILVTVSSQQGIGDVKRRLNKINNKNAKVILGGGGCYAPAVFNDIADAICVGEGRNFINTLVQKSYEDACQLPNVWIPGEDRTVIPDIGFPWECPPLLHPDGTIRLFAARGCKSKCLFCQTGWQSPYIVNPNTDLLKYQFNYQKQLGKRVALVTNNGVDNLMMGSGGHEFLSLRLAGIKKLLEQKTISRKVVKSVRIGVEGLSERLRMAVSKPISNEDLFNCSVDLLSKGIGVTWFFITGLPNETEDDYLEFRETIKALKTIKKGVVMMTFHAFIPQPATPLSVLPLIDNYWEWFDEFRRWFFHGPGFTSHVQIVTPAKYPGRIKRAMESMGTDEVNLRRGWFDHDNENWRVEYLKPPAKLREIAKKYQLRFM